MRWMEVVGRLRIVERRSEAMKEVVEQMIVFVKAAHQLCS